MKPQAGKVLVIAVLLAAVLAYFGRPRPPLLELVTPGQEMPDWQSHMPEHSSLAERVSRSNRIALVLVRSPYTAANAIALEAVRNWASARFQSHPGFLYPAALEDRPAASDSIINSVFYNLGAYIVFGLQDVTGSLLRARIADFHQSPAYFSFRAAYFDLFGQDADSATLLARYQSGRARLSINVILWGSLWLVAIVAGILALARAKRDTRFERLRAVLSFAWLLMAACYLAGALSENNVSMMVSAIVSIAAGLLLRRPIAINKAAGGGWAINKIRLSPGKIALALWLTFSIWAIQLLTWIRLGSLSTPDPVTLLLSSFSGDFLHDPAIGKRWLMHWLAATWVFLGWFTARRLGREEDETERRLDSLQGPYPS